MGKRVQLAIDLVHRRDSLLRERAQLTAALDAQIGQIDEELASLTGDADQQPAVAAAHVLAPTVGNGNGKSLTDKLLGLLIASPGADYGTLAVQIYGSDGEKNRGKLRSLLYFLSKKGAVKSKGAGRWEVTSTN